MLDQLRSAQGLPRVTHEAFEKIKFSYGQIQFTSSVMTAPLGSIQSKVSEVQMVWANDSAAPQECFDACQNFSNIEWFSDEVIRPSLESCDAIVHFVAGRDHDHWQLIAGIT
jgi:hypothetical protein